MSNDWENRGDRLVRTYRFADFSAAMSFMVEAGFAAEKLNHHPEWTNVYNRVHVELTTHDTGGLTGKDHALAAEMDRIYQRHLPQG